MMTGLRTMTMEAMTEAGGALRRITLLSTVAALMAVMLVVGAAPALAHYVDNEGCGDKEIEWVVTGGGYDRNNDGIHCSYQHPKFGERYKDNHVHK